MSARSGVTPVEIAFASRAVRKICENDNAAEGLLGANLARKLRARLADLKAASTVRESPFRLRKMRNRGATEIAIDLSSLASVVFCANHATCPRTLKGSVDWSRVERIKIVQIENRKSL
jgi:hypothetical protein